MCVEARIKRKVREEVHAKKSKSFLEGNLCVLSVFSFADFAFNFRPKHNLTYEKVH